MNLVKRLLGEDVEAAEETVAVDAASPEVMDDGDGLDNPVSSIVQTLASSWRSGNRIDVAQRLLTEPISYADYARLMFVIGEQDAVELGHVLDELAEEPATAGGEAVEEPVDMDPTAVRAALEGDQP